MSRELRARLGCQLPGSNPSSRVLSRGLKKPHSLAGIDHKSTMGSKYQQSLVLLFLCFCCYLYIGEASTVSCGLDDDCENALMEGSKCIDGFCTNPFHYNGCLASRLPGWTKSRVCGSEDSIGTKAKGYCRVSPWDEHYMETRILAQDFSSAWIETWVLQILLNEVLEVPVSIEESSRGGNLDFYDLQSSLECGDEIHYDRPLVEGSKGDCRRLQSVWEDEAEPYQDCAHVITEIWAVDLNSDGGLDGAEEPLLELGAIGHNHLFVPRFTMERDPSFVTYTGLGGEANREKLAATFKRPTTWKQYCDEVSSNNCAIPDSISSRAPQNEAESISYFVEGSYIGHFRDTDESNCELNPECTGEVVDFPCDWGSHTIQQMYHLDIKLKGSGDDAVGGYDVSHAEQIWKAANATRSDVIMAWWYPDPFYDKWIGTDAEMTKVILPPPTQKCLNARASTGYRCDNGEANTTYQGDAVGACDYSSQFLKKAVTETFGDITRSPDVSRALWSPAYDTIVNWQLSELELGEIFQMQQEQPTDMGDFSSRAAVCQWVVDHFDRIQSFIPETYPRAIEEEDVSEDPLFITATIVAGFTILLCVGLAAATHVKRNTQVIYFAQPNFLFFLLLGSLLVAIAAVLVAAAHSDATCILAAWLVNIGFVLQFVPLFVRMNAINKLAGTGKTMQRVRLKTRHLLRHVLVSVFAVSCFLFVWTITDPPNAGNTFELTAETNAEGETIVVMHDSCGSDEDIWGYIYFAWQGVLLLLCAMSSSMALAVKEDMNDTMEMSRMIFIHLTFFVFRVVVGLMLTGDEQVSDYRGYQSLMLSISVAAALLVYLIPKFVSSGEVVEEEPLPDLFLHTTIMVSDITGFSAWCSVREPVQVFMFLEQLYEAFDKVAEKHNVFKVETVREQYVAATGIPEAHIDHMVVMGRFASDCIKKMGLLAAQLEVKYGPDTADLHLQIGLHSGPVTGGFLKRKGARFQLFGDTMTTTSLIHAYGESGRIHMSEETANLLIKAGKKRWVEQRDHKIQTTVKGEIQTYWLTRGSERVSGQHSVESSSQKDSTGHSGADIDLIQNSESRWIDFNVEILKKQLKPIIARRSLGRRGSFERVQYSEDSDDATMPLEEVKEIIELPIFDKKAAKRQLESDDIVIDEKVTRQLRDFVDSVSSMYNNNAFHNFAHASYVVMAIQKYLNRIIAGTEIEVNEEDKNRPSSHSQAVLHAHTYGITSDPLTQFACLFSALIHDADHPGVPNPRLIVENPRVAKIYKERSVAEQKSFDMAWDLLMESRYDELRNVICDNEHELKRFRQLVINSIMATDLGDKELKELRNRRWERAFSDAPSGVEESRSDERNRKATIVIEHLIQAADVAHTCQHWSIYRKWNQRLFEECFVAYRDGRAEKDPTDMWYEGELGFFDFYIIPLAEKLRDCGVFGPTSDENLNYARSNRAMWVKEGKSIVASMVEKMKGLRSNEDTEFDSEEYVE